MLGDDGNKVRLLAKYCLNQEGTAQATSYYGKNFASTNYWKDESGITYPYELQIPESRFNLIPSGDTVANNAIKTAQAYGTSKGVEGRLMTYEEAREAGVSTSYLYEPRLTKIQRIIFGRWTAEDINQITSDAPTYGLYFWIWAAYRDTHVMYTECSNQNCWLNCSGMYYKCGVRPVLVVSETSVSP